jgi:hypothetical protein
MTKKIIALFVFIAVIFIGSVCAYSFDKEPGSIAIGGEPEFSYVKITTIGSAEGLVPVLPHPYTGHIKWKKSKGSFLLQGVGFVVKGGYIITASHVVHPTHITTSANKYSHFVDKPIKILFRSIIITGDTEIDEIEYGTYAEIYYLDIEHDIAILKFEPNNIYDSVPYELTETRFYREGGWGGNYSLLQPGDSVAIITRCRDEDEDWATGFEIRYGKIISEGIKGLPENVMPAFSMNDFTTDAIIYPGDSGSAVFAFSLGKPVIVGVVIATNDKPSIFGRIPSKEGFRSYATRIDFVKKIIESE